jgi:hypothetical protein
VSVKDETKNAVLLLVTTNGLSLIFTYVVCLLELSPQIVMFPQLIRVFEMILLTASAHNYLRKVFPSTPSSFLLFSLKFFVCLPSILLFVYPCSQCAPVVLFAVLQQV